MSATGESPLSLAPYIKSCVKMLKFSGCVWNWPMLHTKFARFKCVVFKIYFLGVMTYLLSTCAYMLTINDLVHRNRQLALTLQIANSNAQILVLYLKRGAFHRFIQSTPEFANKNAVEMQLKHALKIIKPWIVLKGIAYLAIFIHNVLSIAIKIQNTLKEVVVENEADLEFFYGSLHVAGYVVRMMRVYSLTSMFVFQFGLSWLLMTMLVFINGYLNHLKICLLRVKIRDPMEINLAWIADYDLVSGEYDMRYCVTMHQYVIRLVHQANEIFSWVIQLVIWQALMAFIIGIRLFINGNPSSERVLHFTIIYAIEMLSYCYLADDINRKSENLATICFQKLYSAGDMIVGDWKTLQVVAVRCQSESLYIKAGPFSILNLRTFIAMFAVTLTLISLS